MTIETPRSIARDGGWQTYTADAFVRLRQPYRHHLVAGRVSADVYILPESADTPSLPLGRGVPRGTVMWVHNRNGGGHAVLVVDATATFVFVVEANKSQAFALMAVGLWVPLFTGNGAAATAGPTLPDGFRLDLVLRQSQNNVNVLREAVEAGYDGTEPALVRVIVQPGVVLGSASRLVAALDIGGDTAVSSINWAAGTKVFVVNSGTISGKGGDGGGGGVGGTGASTGTVGEDGGLALRAPIDVLIDNLGTIQGGGGGGGGGNGSAVTAGLHGGAGGGGAGAFIDGTGTIRGGRGGAAATGAVAGANGNLFVAGAYGVGSLVSPNIGGQGGVGGAPAQPGLPGNTLNNLAGGSFGGAAGAAISRASGATVSFLTAGTVTGATVVA